MRNDKVLNTHTNFPSDYLRINIQGLGHHSQEISMEVGFIVGGKVACAVISKLINGIIDYAKGQKKMQLGLKVELKRLEKALPKIQAVVNAVDQGLVKDENPPLGKWLWQLRDAADQADDVMDEMEYNFVKEKVEVGESKVSEAVYNFKIFLERMVHKDGFLKRLKAAVKTIDDVASDVSDFYKLVRDLEKKQKKMARSVINSRETSPVLNGETLFGRQNEKEDIIKKLLNPEYKTKKVNFAVLPIIGGGGVGKTALVQHVYNDPEVKKHFDLRMWVCISNNFDVQLLTKKLYETVFERKADFISFGLIQEKLEYELASKRFLVVFDDAWNDDDGIGWKKLFAPLKYGRSGSMILLTTRMETVARLTGPNLMDAIFLKGLNERDMWDLFVECALGGEDPNNHMELVEIGRSIVKKLKGYPLAARTVGGALCSDLSEIHWRSILKSELWRLEQGPNDIMPALRLSYQHLQPHLKPCFAFCSIFPQDHVFIKDDLIYMWLALGLVPRDFNGARKPEDVGSKYFEDMLKRSFFSPANPVNIAHLGYPAYTYCIEKQLIGGYVMHDLMHDLSAFVSQGECFISDTNKAVPIPTTVRHLYIRVGDCGVLHSLNLKNIRTLILQFDDSNNHPKLVCILKEMLKGMRSLRILTLFALNLSEIPGSVSDLLHLRYLSLSSIMLGGFPQSMSRLVLLETIVSGGFGSDKQADILVKLINLRHIIASQPFVETIAGIGRLTSLQELCFRVGKDRGFKISELGDMGELRRLSISNINDVNTPEEAKHANLINKVSLRELSLQWETRHHIWNFPKNHETKKFDEMVFDDLEPNCNLKELRIRSYMGGRLPLWMSESLSSLVKIEISDCGNLMSLDEGLLRNSKILAALEELTLMNCKELKMPKEGFNKLISLKRLDINECPKIKVFNMLVLLYPCKLRFLRINNYVDDGIENNGHVKDIIGETFLRELSMQSAPTLQTEDAKLLVLDHPGENSNWEVRLWRIRDYIGGWPHIWLKQTPSMLEYLCIDGSPLVNYHSSRLPDGINELLELISHDEKIKGYVPFLEMAHPSYMPVQEQFFLAMQHVTSMLFLKKLTVILCSQSCVMPPLPVTLNELRLCYLGSEVLPYLFENQSRESGSLPSLVNMAILGCPNLVSLAEGLLQKPQQFSALEKLHIWGCEMLRKLPQGGFSKLISLKELHMENCTGISGQSVQECFLPATLQVLKFYSCGDLDGTLAKALESVHSLISLDLGKCENITSLPQKEVFSRWKNLEKLNVRDNSKLTSLEGLVGCSSIKQLTIISCPKLVSSIPSPSSSRAVGRKPLLSVDRLLIDDPLILSIEPIRNISAVRELTIRDCKKLQSLPELPPVFEELSLHSCSTELESRCKDNSGEDWPKLSHIPRVHISHKGWQSG